MKFTHVSVVSHLPRAQVARFLVEAKSDLELPDEQGNTPLHLAAEENFSAVCGCGAWRGGGLLGV